jgi:hypothetical protein
MFVIALGFVLFALASTAVGVRLIVLWRRTREFPELLIGLGVLGIGPVGYGLLTVGMALGEHSPNGAAAIAAAGSLACTVGAGAKFLFNQRVYHPGSRSVGSFVYVVLATSALFYLAHLLAHGFPAGREHLAWYVARGWLQAGCLLWGSCEAFVYYRRMKRRLALGLSNRLTTNRFLLWGIAAGSAGLGTLIGLVAVMLGGQAMMLHPALLACSSTFGSVAAIAMALAFFPPAFYLDRFETTAHSS